MSTRVLIVVVVVIVGCDGAVAAGVDPNPVPDKILVARPTNDCQHERLLLDTRRRKPATRINVNRTQRRGLFHVDIIYSSLEHTHILYVRILYFGEYERITMYSI